MFGLGLVLKVLMKMIHPYWQTKAFFYFLYWLIIVHRARRSRTPTDMHCLPSKIGKSKVWLLFLSIYLLNFADLHVCCTQWSAFIAVITQVLNNPPHVWFVPSTRIFLAKAVYMVLGTSCLSAMKILALGTSTTFCM